MGARGRIYTAVSRATGAAILSLAGCTSTGNVWEPKGPGDGWTLATEDNGIERIGESCPSREEKDFYSLDVCGTKNRVSLEVEEQSGWGGFAQRPVSPVWMPGSPMPVGANSAALPCEPVPLPGPREYHGPDSRWACVANDHLVASFECGVCRLPWKKAVHARISELTREQATAIFGQLGLSGEVPTNALGWQASFDEVRSMERPKERLAWPVPEPR